MFNEETLEKITMEILEELEYECINGYEMERTDFSKVILEEDLKETIRKINSNVSEEELTEIMRQIKNLNNNNIILNNKQFTKYLLEGVSVPVNENGETRYKTIKIVDFDNISNNIFKAINQYTIIEHSEKRPDIIIFVNGLPLVVVELKSTVREEVKLSFFRICSYVMFSALNIYGEEERNIRRHALFILRHADERERENSDLLFLWKI